MADLLLNEVDADIRAEKLERFWQHWRTPIALFCILLIVGTAADQLWQRYREHRGAEWFATLSAAQKRLSQGRQMEAKEDFVKVAAEAKGDAKTIAQLWVGRVALAQNNAAEASAAFKAASEAKPSLWSDLGCLRLAAVDAPQALGCLNANTDTPLRAKRQLWGAAILSGQDKSPEALAQLSALANDSSLSDTERAQAAQWASALQPEVQAKEAAAARMKDMEKAGK